MTLQKLVIASRESALAMWQAEHIQSRLRALYPGCEVSILGLTTQGDRILDKTLSKIGGKGLFVKELEQALSDGRADLAVHSIKDVPMVLPEGFALAAICERESPFDAFVSNNYQRLEDLPAGAVVGTSSLRREAQLRARFPQLQVAPLRGNVQTRLDKLDRGDFDAIVLACAGLIRLGLQARIRAELPPEQSLPAIGQGAIGIECHETSAVYPLLDDFAERAETVPINAFQTTFAHAETADLFGDGSLLLAALDDADTALCVHTERIINTHLEGSCQVPLAAHAALHGERIHLAARIGMPDGSRYLSAADDAPRRDAEALGNHIAARLIADGARDILQTLSHE